MRKASKFILLILLSITAYWMTIIKAEGLPFIQDFRIEAKISRELKAPILVLFMSNTCHYCEIVLQDFLLPMQDDPSHKEKVILRQVEISSNDKLINFDGKVTTQQNLSFKHNARMTPTIVLFDSKGQELTRIVGLLTVDYYLAYLNNAIDDSREKIKADAK